MTAVHEDYLRTIYMLMQRGEQPTTTAIAGQMGVSPASATNMLKKLAGLGLVDYRPYQGAKLSTAGERIALEVTRHHRLLELFCSQVLEMPWDQVDKEADRLEHVISETLEEAIARKMGYPRVDPHGDPIPAEDLSVPELDGVPLITLPVGHCADVVRVLAQEPEHLRYLGSLGLYPGRHLRVIQKAPFAGPLLLAIAAKQVMLAADMAEQILVREAACVETHHPPEEPD